MALPALTIADLYDILTKFFPIKAKMDIIKHINWVDILAVIIIIRMSYAAFREGLAHELFPLFATIFVMVLSLRYYSSFGSVISKQLFNVSIQFSNFVSFLMIAIASMLVLNLINALLNNIVKVQWNPIIEKFGGLIFGAVRAFITASLVLIILALMPLPYFQRSIKDKSLIGMHVLGIGPSIYGKVSPFLPNINIGGSAASKDEIMNNLVSVKSVSTTAKKEEDASRNK